MLSASFRLLRLSSPAPLARQSFSVLSSCSHTLQPTDPLIQSPVQSGPSASSSVEEYVAQFSTASPEISALVPPLPTPNQPQQISKVPADPEWALRAHPEIYDPPILKPTHRIHVATLVVEAYNPSKEELPIVTGFALQAAYHLGIPVSRPAAMPIKTELHTVLRSGFVHKKSQENIWRLTHRRVIKAYDANEEVVNRWINYVRTDAAYGTRVSLKAQRFLYRPVGWGAQVDLLATRESELESLERPKPEKKHKTPKPSSVDPTLVEVSPADAVKALAEQLIKDELQPKADAHEAMLASTGTKDGKPFSELLPTTSNSKPS